MANNEHRVLKNNTFEDWRQKSNEVSFDLGDNALLDNTRLGDKVYNYTASAGQVFVSGNDTASKTLVIEKLPDALIDNTGGYIILAHGTTIPGAFVNGATVTQGSDYSATIESVVTVDNKSKILVKNSTGTFSTSTNLTVGSASIAHANVERIVSESFSKGSIRVKKGGSELVQDLSEAGFHIANHKGTIALTGSPSVDKVTEGITIYQASANQTSQANVEANATWWATVLHSNTTRIKTKNNNGNLNAGADIRILGYAPSAAKVDAAKVSGITLNDDSQLHTVELNNEASASDAIVVITTNLVDAVNELQDDIGTVENLATATQADVVSAINEIEGVFDASTKEISAGSNAFNVTSGDFTIDSSGDITLDADGADIFLKDNGTSFGSFTQMIGGLGFKAGPSLETTMLLSTSGNTLFFGDIELGDNKEIILGNSGGDLKLYHNASDSYIEDYGTGDLVLKTNGAQISLKGGTEDMVEAIKDGAVNLYHNGAKKLETKSDGVDVTGELQSDSLDVDGIANISGAVTLQTSATVGTTLGVTGLSTLGSLTVTGATQLNGGLTMDTNKFTVANGSGNTLIAGTLNVDGAVDFDSTLDVFNATTLRSSLDVTGATAMGGDLTINTDKFTVNATNGNTAISGTLGVTGNVTIGSLTGSTAQDVRGAINELRSDLGSALFNDNGSGFTLLDGAGSVTVALKTIEEEIGDYTSYETSNANITYGGNTIAGALVSLNDGIKSNDTDISTLQNRNINTVTAGSGLTGGGNLTADRSLSVVVDNSSIEIPTSGAGVQNKLRVKAGGITNNMLAGSIANSKLVNSAVSINSQSISLGGSHTFNTDAFAEGTTNKYFTNERVDDRVADFLIAGKGLGKVEDDDDQGDDSLTINVNASIAGAGLTWDNSGDGVLNIEAASGNPGITVSANAIAVDSTVLRTNVNSTVADGTTLTVAGSLDLSNASVTFPSGGSGSVQNVGTQFLSITAGQTEQGLKIDRSEINSSNVIDPAIQWDNAKAFDLGWEVVYPNGADNAAEHASLVTFENAGKLIGEGTSNDELGISVTWDNSSNTFDFNVNDPVLTFTSSTFRSSGNLGQGTITNLGNTTFALTANKLDLGYSEKILLGNSDEFAIFNDNANSYITSSDNLIVNVDHLAINNGANSENMIVAVGNGAVSLFYDNSSKLQTKTDGVNISGELEATSLDINGNADISGNLTLGGNLNITGDINSHNVTDLDVTDKTITVGVGQDASASTGSGLVVAGSNAEIKWHNTNNRWESNKNISAATFIGALQGNADTATTASAVAWGNVTGKPTLDNYVSWTATDGASSPTSYTVTSTDALSFIDSTHIQPRFHADDQLKFHLASNSVGASVLNVSGNGSAGQALISDGDGSMSWSTISGDNTTYDLSVAQRTTNNNDDPFLRLDPSSGSNDDIRFTGGNGITITRMGPTEIKFDGASTYVLPEATSTVRGGVELFSDTDQTVAANSVSSTAGRTYGIQLNSSGQMVVNVPWVDTNTDTNTTYSAGVGLVLSGTTFKANLIDETLRSVTANSITTTASRTYAVMPDADGDLVVNVPWSDTNTVYSLPQATSTTRGGVELRDNDVQTVAANAVSSTAGRTYGIQLNSDNQMVVNVPWTDTNTTYSTANSTTLGLVKIGYTENGKNYPVELSNGQMFVNVPWTDTNTNTTYTAGVGLVLAGTVFKANLIDETQRSVTANSITTTANRTYAVMPDADGDLVVNVPWSDTNTDTNTTYTAGVGLSLVSSTIFKANVHSTVQTIATSTPSATASRTYAVQVNNADELVVNVPWSDTNTDTNTTNWNFKTDTHATNSVNISAGETIDYIGGTNITTSHSGNDITIDCDIDNCYDGISVTNSSGSVKFSHGANGVSDDIILKEGSNITLTDGGDDIVVITAANTTYSAGTGLDLSTTTFSLEPDLRNEVDYIGGSGSVNDYIDMSAAAQFKIVFDAVEDFRFSDGGTFHTRGDMIAFSSTITSDENLKDNIQKVDGALELVSQLDGVTFNWKKDGKASAGVIAQNVEKVLPSAVKEVESLDGENHKHVDYNQLSALFIEAIKELKEENNLLKAEIESLKDINNR